MCARVPISLLMYQDGRIQICNNDNAIYIVLQYAPIEYDEQGSQASSDGRARKGPSQVEEDQELYALHVEHDIDVEVHWFDKMLQVGNWMII